MRASSAAAKVAVIARANVAAAVEGVAFDRSRLLGRAIIREASGVNVAGDRDVTVGEPCMAGGDTLFAAGHAAATPNARVSRRVG